MWPNKKSNTNMIIDKKLLKKFTDLAIKDMSEYKDELDFSNNSIKIVEKFLDEVHRQYKIDKKEDGLFGIALECGNYIVSTIEHNYGEGEFKRDHPEMGEGAFPFSIDGQVIFPVMWCMKRIYDGKADNVWSKYNYFIINKIKNKDS